MIAKIVLRRVVSVLCNERLKDLYFDNENLWKVFNSIRVVNCKKE